MTTLFVPTALNRKADTALVVSWNDGVKSEYELRTLRLNCPCAGCVNEWSGEKMLNPEAIPKGVKPVRLYSVGRYAVGVQWNDGHSTGIYSYDYLRRLSEGSTGVS